MAAVQVSNQQETEDGFRFDVTVEDNQEGSIVCPKDVLQPGESMTCTQDGVADLVKYANVGMVTGRDDLDRTAADEDPSHYFGEPVDEGDEGCTPGYWKNHTDSWPPTGYSPGQSLPSVFAQSAAYPELASATLLDALNFGGGGGVDGAARNLMRAAVAALLDASHPGVDYPRTPVQVVSQVNSALASGDRDTMLTVAGGGLTGPTLIAINDLAADGRDVSGLWDVDFEMLCHGPAPLFTTGIRGADMANRLKYAGMPAERIRPLPADLSSGLDAFVDSLGDGAVGYVLLTYTALLGLRQVLADRGAVDHFWEQ